MYTWDLSILYNGFDDTRFEADFGELAKVAAELGEKAKTAHAMGVKELLCEYIRISEAITSLGEKLFVYANLRYSQNTADGEAATAMGRIMGILSTVAAPEALFKAAIAKVENLSGEIEAAGLGEYRYVLEKVQSSAKYLLSDGEEELLAKLNISGADAWSNLQSTLTSSVKVKYRGEQITLSAVRNLAYDPDPRVRLDAYKAELECYGAIKDSVAFALNSIKHQVITECEARGYESPLHKALYDSRLKKETLDALIAAMEEYMPHFRKYLKAKAKALGHKGALPWYDLFAPMGKSDKKFSVEDAKDYLLGIFSTFDSELHDLVKTAFEQRWIDFFPREGKVGGAFDCAVPSAGVSRVLTNFDGSFSDVVTLAHELGHSFHDRQVLPNSPLNQSYSMPVAETASTFNEVLVMQKAIATATDREEKLALIESQLSDATQIICDIYSRYTFEASVFANRPNEFMSADRMCELMLAAQDKAYGDGLDPEFKHPYMWLCKGHYYSGGLSFYNYPYAFGGLFARGLYAKYKKEGEPFVATYKRMLNYTGTSDVEQAAAAAGVDVTSVDFWRQGLATIAAEIDEFCELCK